MKNSENLENSNNQNLKEKNKAIFENNANENSENSNSKFKLSGWDKFKIIISLLFAIYGWYFYLSYPNPKSIDELQTCVGKIEYLSDRYSGGRGGGIYFDLKLKTNDNKTLNFTFKNLNHLYGFEKEATFEFNLKHNKKYLENLSAIKNKSAKIWYIRDRILFKTTNIAYQIQILDFDYEKNPNLKELEYITNFSRPVYHKLGFFIVLFFINAIFLLLITKLLIKSRRIKWQQSIL